MTEIYKNLVWYSQQLKTIADCYQQTEQQNASEFITQTLKSGTARELRTLAKNINKLAKQINE